MPTLKNIKLVEIFQEVKVLKVVFLKDAEFRSGKTTVIHADNPVY